MNPRSGGSKERVFSALDAMASFAHFADDQVAALATVSERVAFAPGGAIYGEGDDDRDLWVVLSGAVELSRATPAGAQRLARLGWGSLLGEISFLDGLSREATAVCAGRGELLRVPLGPATRLMESDPVFAAALFRSFWLALARKVREANEAMTRLIASGRRASPAGGTAGLRLAIGENAKLAVLTGQGLSGRGVDTLARSMRTERFEAEEMIFSEGSAGTVFYVVADGTARISRRLPGIGEEALLFAHRGDFFGAVSFMDRRPRTADAKAHGQGCTVLSIDRRRLEGLLARDPVASREFLALVCRGLCSRVRGMAGQLVAWRIMAGFGHAAPLPEE